jgi:PPOX class probable F420-dependent enzyme
MSEKIPDRFHDLFRTQAFAHLATLLPSGAPQVSPVWCDFDGTHVLINTEKSRLKLRNAERDPRVALSIQDPANPYRYIEVRGRVAATTEDGAARHIDRLAQRYMGIDRYPNNRPGDVRVIMKIAPESVHWME